MGRAPSHSCSRLQLMGRTSRHRFTDSIVFFPTQAFPLDCIPLVCIHFLKLLRLMEQYWSCLTTFVILSVTCPWFWQEPLKEGHFCSQFEFSSLWQGKVYGRGRSKQLATPQHSQLRSRDRWRSSSSLLLSSGPQPRGWCCSQLRWVFLL